MVSILDIFSFLEVESQISIVFTFVHQHNHVTLKQTLVLYLYCFQAVLFLSSPVVSSIWDVRVSRQPWRMTSSFQGGGGSVQTSSSNQPFFNTGSSPTPPIGLSVGTGNTGRHKSTDDALEKNANQVIAISYHHGRNGFFSFKLSVIVNIVVRKKLLFITVRNGGFCSKILDLLMA